MAKAKKAAPAAAELQQAVAAEPVQTIDTPIEPVQLTIADLQLLGRIVDLASRRGAFQANELSQVGEAYNKLTGFLTYVESVQPKEAEDAAAVHTQEPVAA